MTRALNTLISAQFVDARNTGAPAEILNGNYKDEASLDTALATASAAYYTAARLATMSINDKIFALRSAVDSAGFKTALAPTANFTFVPTALSVAFTNTSKDPQAAPLTYRWDFGDGTAVDTTTSPTHVYAGAGTYQVRLVAANNLGRADDEIKSVTVA